MEATPSQHNTESEKENEKQDVTTLKHISKWRVAAPQILAASAKNLLLLDLGMTIAFSTIVVPVLLKGQDSQGLKFTPEEVSWYSSIGFVCQPLGSVVSGFILEPLGRKKAMMLVNIPHIFGWLVFYYTTSKYLIYIATAIMGFGMGFMEAPILTYVGEIAQPHLRGTLTSYANLFVTFGMGVIYVFGAMMDWRTAAAISSLVPVITIFVISQVPETPIWLMSKGKKDEAEKSLCWLRGWVGPEYVKDEFDKLSQYTESTKLKKDGKTGVINRGFINDDGTPGLNDKEYKDLTLTEKVRDFIRPGLMKPMFFIIVAFLFEKFTGIVSTRPYMTVIAEELKMPLKPADATIVFGAAGFVGSIFCIATIAKFKKRPMGIFSMSVACICDFCLCFSKDPWVVFIAYIVLMFVSLYGINSLVWTLVSEVFPYRGRGLASGIAAATSYLIAFLSTKSYQSLKDWLTFQGTFALYGTMCLIGVVFFFVCMPETEGRSLEEIEHDYENGVPQKGSKLNGSTKKQSKENGIELADKKTANAV